MMYGSLQVRTGTAQRIRASREQVARGATWVFFNRHPEWLERYGERGLQLGFEDACFHVDFLSSAIEAGEVSAFVEYVSWAKGMLESRGIAAEFLAENISQLGVEIAIHLDPSEKQHLLEFVDAGLLACTRPSLPTHGITNRAANVYMQALQAGNRSAALNIAKECVANGHGVAQVYLEVLQPAMYEIGRLWETNRITVAREHMATAITQYVMAQLFPMLCPSPTAKRGNAVVVGVQGELHQLGALMVSDLLESEGWFVRFLGSNVPQAGILDVIKQENATLLGISTTLLTNMPKALELIKSARNNFPGIRIIVGGAAFKSSGELWKEAGADHFASDLKAVISLT
jgi:MerR family transcriptional regulator, light-induced transcriptional regulator